VTARERFLDGAAEVLRSRGFAAATTKEIASAAGLSEAMLYKVFRDKVDLFLGVLTERLPRVALVRDGSPSRSATASSARLSNDSLQSSWSSTARPFPSPRQCSLTRGS
jgi:AcrR family transcriptional regulator